MTLVSALTDKLLADMKPNQKAIIPLREMEKCKLAACDAEVESVWRLGKLKIENENLQEIVQKMERWYGIKIQLHDVPENKRYWMTIKTESLREMPEIINRVTPITYTINGEEVSITGRKRNSRRIKKDAEECHLPRPKSKTCVCMLSVRRMAQV